MRERFPARLRAALPFLVAWGQAWAIVWGAALFGLVAFGGILVGWAPVLEVGGWALFASLAFTLWCELTKRQNAQGVER